MKVIFTILILAIATFYKVEALGGVLGCGGGGGSALGLDHLLSGLKLDGVVGNVVGTLGNIVPSSILGTVKGLVDEIVGLVQELVNEIGGQPQDAHKVVTAILQMDQNGKQLDQYHKKYFPNCDMKKLMSTTL